MNILNIIGLALIATAICILLKQYKPEYAMLVSLACGIIIFFMVVAGLTPAFASITRLLNKVAINNEYSKAIIKTLGVCYVTQLASDSCKDAGESAIASKVELCGKVYIVIISLPMFENLVNIAFKLINNTY